MSDKQIQWISTSRQAYWNEKQPVRAVDGSPNLTLTDWKQQVFEGFGGCFSELGMVALQHLTEEDRNKVYDALFSPDGECKLPIGASDYALEWYSHNEVDGDYDTEYFNIERE